MSKVILEVQLEFDIINSQITNSITMVSNALGYDITDNFRNFVKINKIPTSNQCEIELALLQYVKCNENILP